MPLTANWNYPTSVSVGPGRINELSSLCESLDMLRPLVVTDPGLARLPMIQAVLDQVSSAGLKVALYSEVQPNPAGSDVTAAIQVCEAGQHDGIIAIGGGSALDVGKTVALMAKQSCDIWELEDIGDNWLRADSARVLPTIAIPTTAGTGSEVGRAALLVNEAEHRKVIIFHPLMLPDRVILDPEVTISLPPHLTAATGMDALSHSLEAYCSPIYHPMAEAIAMEGMRLVKDHLPTAVNSGDNIEARTQMLVASMMGATAFQKGLGAMHALAHPLGAIYQAHHGLLNAILMPYVLKANYPVIKSTIPRLASYLNLNDSFDAFIEWVLALRADLGIPHTLNELVEEDKWFSQIGQMAIDDPSAGTNPVQLSASQYQQLFQDACSGKI